MCSAYQIRSDPMLTNSPRRFGAVLEEFEVRDALNAVFSAKSEVGVAY